MTTGSDIGISIIQAIDVQNPLHYGEMKVKLLFSLVALEYGFGNSVETENAIDIPLSKMFPRGFPACPVAG